jgi:protein TonB
VRFKIDRSGRVLGVSLVKSTGNSLIDRTALAMVRQGGYPAAPASLPAPTFVWEFNIAFTR